MYEKYDYKTLFDFTVRNKTAIMASKVCFCLVCGYISEPHTISYTRGTTDGICPHCHEIFMIGDAQVPVEDHKDVLNTFHSYTTFNRFGVLDIGSDVIVAIGVPEDFEGV